MNHIEQHFQQWKECKCTFSQKMVGDGCSVCQPGTYRKFMEQQQKDIERELEEKRNQELLKCVPDERLSL